MSPATALLCAFLAVAPVFPSIYGLGENVKRQFSIDEKRADDDVSMKIAALSAGIGSNMRSGNMAQLLTYCADDIMVLAAGRGYYQGKATLEQSLGRVLHLFAGMDWTCMEVVPLDSEAQYVFERVNYKLYSKEKLPVFDGKMLIIWKKYGNTYKNYIWMNNENTPVDMPK